MQPLTKPAGSEHFATVFVHLNLKTLPHVRRFVRGFVESNGRDDPDFVSGLVVAVHELLENAVRYSTDSTTSLEVKLDLCHSHHVVLITRNQATRESAARVRGQISRLQGGEPAKVYQEMLHESAKSAEQSGLGLARIVAECQMSLSSAYDESGELSIEAISNLPKVA